ncbi:11614_t:CDS:10 [Funneliformis geosporum]|uniref:11614_t:CDS:1 n=1 Tax=Funneliformis geosporum TaxID=1117311 RepID=A0A9W4X625_9GLOM|nr:11614_t:CDS:10 [Funneliformis geosporum]
MAQLQIAIEIPLHQIRDIRVLHGLAPSGTSEIDFDFSDPESLQTQRRPAPKGHVIAVRITAENSDAGFKPSSGMVHELNFRSSTNNRQQSRKNMIVALKEFFTTGWLDENLTADKPDKIRDILLTVFIIDFIYEGVHYKCTATRSALDSYTLYLHRSHAYLPVKTTKSKGGDQLKTDGEGIKTIINGVNIKITIDYEVVIVQPPQLQITIYETNDEQEGQFRTDVSQFPPDSTKILSTPDGICIVAFVKEQQQSLFPEVESSEITLDKIIDDGTPQKKFGKPANKVVGMPSTKYQLQQSLEKSTGQVKFKSAASSDDIKEGENIIIMDKKYEFDFRIESKTKFNGFIDSYKLMFEKYPIVLIVNKKERLLGLHIVLDILQDNQTLKNIY